MVYTLKDATAAFKSLATDDRLPHALMGRCEDRREAMIGIMLDELKVPRENIGRIVVVAEPFKGIVVPRPDRIIGPKRYEEAAWLKKQIEVHQALLSGKELSEKDSKDFDAQHVDWSFHTAVTIKCYNPFMEEDVVMVIDPHLNPTRLITAHEFNTHLQRHSQGHLTSDISPLDEPNTALLRARGGFHQWNNNAADIREDKDKILKSLEWPSDILRQQGLLGQGYIDAWQAMRDWSQTPGL